MRGVREQSGPRSAPDGLDPHADEHREMLRATHVKPLPPIHGLGPGRLGILRRRMGRGPSDSGTDGEWRAR